MRVVVRKEPKSVGYLKTVICTGQGNKARRDYEACGSTLEVELDDLRFYDGTSGYFQRDSAVCFKCPVCNHITDLELKDWPRTRANLQTFSTAWADSNV